MTEMEQKTQAELKRRGINTASAPVEASAPVVASDPKLFHNGPQPPVGTSSNFQSGGKYGPFLYSFVRRHIARGLVNDNGFDWSTALAQANDISNQDIDDQADKASLNNDNKVGALGDGHILQWIQDHQAQILQVIQTIIGIIMMLVPKTPAATNPKTPDPKTPDQKASA